MSLLPAVRSQWTPHASDAPSLTLQRSFPSPSANPRSAWCDLCLPGTGPGTGPDPRKPRRHDIVPKKEEQQYCGDSGMQCTAVLLDESLKPLRYPNGLPDTQSAHRSLPSRTQASSQYKRSPHSRSKAGCGTCRRRKKKCDETRPMCKNCEKNNVVCDGYEPKMPWMTGKQRSQSLSTSEPSTPLSSCVPGLDEPEDMLLLQHFVCEVSNRLLLADEGNPFLEKVLPMAFQHPGLMHGLLYLSGSCFAGSHDSSDPTFQRLHEHHGYESVSMLGREVQLLVSARGDAHVGGDAVIAQALMLCLETVCSGNTKGSFRSHLNAMKSMLDQDSAPAPDPALRRFLLEFLLYHVYASAVTSASNPLDERSLTLMDACRRTETLAPSALIGVLDGLFVFLGRVRLLRDSVRRQRSDGLPWWNDAGMRVEASTLDASLRSWTPAPACARGSQSASPRHLVGLLYRDCVALYLRRSVGFSRPHPAYAAAVDSGLRLLRSLTRDSAVAASAVLLLPILILGSAAFDPAQRPPLVAALDRLARSPRPANVAHVRAVLLELWRLMDAGKEDESWDWEALMVAKDWDFLAT